MSPLSTRELDQRLRHLEQLNIPQIKADASKQEILLEGIKEDVKDVRDSVKEVKDSIQWIVRLVAGAVVIGVIGLMFSVVKL